MKLEKFRWRKIKCSLGPPEASFSLVCWKKERRKKERYIKKKKEGRERERKERMNEK